MGSKVILAPDDALYDLAARVVSLACEKGLTVGTAESCTGGLVAGALTAVPGSSAAVRGGVVSYAIPVKHEVLGVPYEGVLGVPEVGAVSEECARAMAEGARRVLGCDLCVSLTGIAGPGGAEPGKPVGTVWMGVARAGQTQALRSLFEGDREQVRHQAVYRALELLCEALLES